MGALHYPIKSQTIKIMSGKALRLPNSANPAKQMPILGLGTWQGKKHEVGDAVETALKAGYKHIDAAAIYGNEAEVGEGIKKSGVDRDSIWITSKLWNNSHKPEEVSKGIEVTAYSPLGAQNPIYGSKNLAKEDPVIVEIAEKYGKTPVQIILSWGATRNTIVIPKSTNAERIQQNLDIIELSGDDMAKIAALDKGLRLNDPSTTFNYVFFADEKPAYKTALDAITNAGKAAKAGIQSAVGQKS